MKARSEVDATARKSISARQRRAIFERHGGICTFCMEPIDPNGPFEISHDVPLGLGGADDDTNRRPAHVACHRAQTRADLKQIAKAKRVGKKHRGEHKGPRRKIGGSRPILGSKNTPFKAKIGGGVERRDA